MKTFQPFVLIVYGNCQRLLGVILSDYVLIKNFFDLCRCRNIEGINMPFLLIFDRILPVICFREDLGTDVNTATADGYAVFCNDHTAGRHGFRFAAERTSDFFIRHKV